MFIRALIFVFVVGVTIPGLARAEGTRGSLPQALPPFTGHVGETLQESQPAFPPPLSAPQGAPNVLLILTDDVGFAASSAFGGPIPTPNLDKLAAHGLRYNEFHTTAMCSPTRAALLTGRNHHAVSTGTIVDLSTGFPGYWSVIPRSAATVARILRDNGYSTAFFGKHHNIPLWQGTAAGPFDFWPTGLGFEYFYGFLGGDTNQWQPKLYRGTNAVDTPHGDPNYILDKDLADDAIHWLHNQKAAAPNKPFLIYYAPGSAHAPHHAPAEWIAKFKGKFDQGWDKVREETFARQKTMGIIPADARLNPRPKEVPGWDSLPADEKRLDARFMEVYAAMLAHQDAQIGRLLDEMERMGVAKNTLVIFVEGDNGASGEGGPKGSFNEIGHLANGNQEPVGWMLDTMGAMGGPHTYEHYPVGWAFAMNTPFQWFKQIGSHLGGTRNGMVVSWPGHLTGEGSVRPQYHHVIDVTPTILEATGIKAPQSVDGFAQQPFDGRSMVYSFTNASAPSPRTTQYFELNGNRGIYHDGWLANTTPKNMPWMLGSNASSNTKDYAWELYDLTKDWSQSNNLASAEPQRLKTLQALFKSEATRNNVFPIQDEAGGARRQGAAFGAPRLQYLFWGPDVSVPVSAAPPIYGLSFSLAAEIETTRKARDGVIAASGSHFGGWSFYLKDGRPVAIEAASMAPNDQFKIAASSALDPGPAKIRFDFQLGPSGHDGTMTIFVNEKEVASGPVGRTLRTAAGIGETFDTGRDTGATVTDDYEGDGRFAGTISKVEVTIKPSAGMMPGMQANPAKAPHDPAAK